MTSSRIILGLSIMAVPIHEIYITASSQFDDADEEFLQNAGRDDQSSSVDLSQTLTDQSELEWSDEEESDGDLGYDEINHADWEVADKGGWSSYFDYD